MWGLIKFLLGVFVLIILISAMSNYFDVRGKCDDRGGNYNLTSNGFKCQGAK